MNQSAERFSRIISPVKAEEFFADYWEKKPLFIGRENSGYFDDVLKPADIQPYFQNQHISSGYIRVVKSGEVCRKETWTAAARNSTDNLAERLIDVRKLFNLFNEGATIIIELCENVFPSLHALIAALENELKCLVQANVYITPQNSFCFEPHFDSHNVFIVQIYGSKKWYLYDSPFEFPVETASLESMNYAEREPEMTVEIKAGDLLYIPRGMVHNASAEDDSSIHITISPIVKHRAGLLKILIEKAENDADFRRLLPLGLSSEKEKNEFASETTKRLRELIAETDFAWMQNERFVKRRRTHIEGFFMDNLQIRKLSADSVICRRPFLDYSFERTDEWIIIRFGGEEIAIPLFLETALAKFFEEKPFAVGEIEGIPNDAGKIAMAKRFIKAGFVKIISV